MGRGSGGESKRKKEKSKPKITKLKTVIIRGVGDKDWGILGVKTPSLGLTFTWPTWCCISRWRSPQCISVGGCQGFSVETRVVVLVV